MLIRPSSALLGSQETSASKLGTSFGLLHNEVKRGLSTISAPFAALCDQAHELAGLAPPEEFDGPPAIILQYFVRLFVDLIWP